MEDEHRVVVTDVRMPFWSMVVFMVKWALASIPAVLIVLLIWFLGAGFLAALSRGDPSRWQLEDARDACLSERRAGETSIEDCMWRRGYKWTGSDWISKSLFEGRR